ncbi:MAG: sugar phosphate isomerase/epimerase [Candidatus Latescibacterota bacterium]|nr:sugar phosphate isomerase/epimerase [Candidatus Latescibacterota bacterium]
MNISCCAWGLPGNEYDTLRTISKLSCSFIDIQSGTYLNHNYSKNQAKHRQQFSCIGLSFNMPGHASMDSPNPKERELALGHIKSGIDHASKCGIETAYVIPGFSQERIPYFNNILLKAADLAAVAGIKLCIEHFPQRALPTAIKTIEHIRELDHDNLFFLLDSGHLQISKEDPQHIVENAGEKLGYVHLDDNDGKRDLHWALCTGVMTLNNLKYLIKTLRSNSYTGALSIELNPTLSAPIQALRESLALLKIILDSSDN